MTAEVIAIKDEIHQQMVETGQRARAAYAQLAQASGEARDMALVQSAMALREQTPAILAANAIDMEYGREKGLDAAMLDRLALNEARVESMAAGLETIATLPDPLSRVLEEWSRPNGLKLQKVSVPLGVIGIIYESRPNVTADAAGLCIKSGNAAILRGGSESLHSSQAIAECLRHGLKAAGLPQDAVQTVSTRDRAAVGEMLTLVGLIDIIVPRGGKTLTKRVIEESRIPTIQHLDGNCHTYLHEKADPGMARNVVLNAKMRRVGICGATESLLIDRSAASRLLPPVADALVGAGCELRGDAQACALDSRIRPATEADWGTEYLAPIISIKLVDGVDEAAAHVNHYGSHHTDAIVTADEKAAARFLSTVDSAIVLHNASTQYADGGEFGFGAEIGISTGRLHARGPVGAEQLTTYKYLVRGNGQVRP